MSDSNYWQAFAFLAFLGQVMAALIVLIVILLLRCRNDRRRRRRSSVSLKLGQQDAFDPLLVKDIYSARLAPKPQKGKSGKVSKKEKEKIVKMHQNELPVGTGLARPSLSTTPPSFRQTKTATTGNFDPRIPPDEDIYEDVSTLLPDRDDDDDSGFNPFSTRNPLALEAASVASEMADLKEQRDSVCIPENFDYFPTSADLYLATKAFQAEQSDDPDSANETTALTAPRSSSETQLHTPEFVTARSSLRSQSSDTPRSSFHVREASSDDMPPVFSDHDDESTPLQPRVPSLSFPSSDDSSSGHRASRQSMKRGISLSQRSRKQQHRVSMPNLNADE